MFVKIFLVFFPATANLTNEIKSLHRAALSLIHTQHVYDLSLTSLVKGVLYDRLRFHQHCTAKHDDIATEIENDAIASRPLSTDDLFIIGSIALVHELYEEAIVWLSKAEQNMAYYSGSNRQTRKCKTKWQIINSFFVIPFTKIIINTLNLS